MSKRKGKERPFSRPLGSAVLNARKARGLSQGQVSNQTGLDPRTILNIENYNGNPRLDSLYTIVRFYGIDPRVFFYHERELEDPARSEFHALVDTCTEEDAATLTPIVRAILEALRDKGTIDLENNAVEIDALENDE